MLKIKIENSMKKVIPKKKKSLGSTNSTMKVKQQLEKSLIKFGYANILQKIFNNKQRNVPSDQIIKSYAGTPKQIKGKTKQNMYQTVFSTKNRSPLTTPMNQSHKGSTRADYKFLYQVGSGGFGRVWKVEHKKEKTIEAMKQISKAKVISKKSINSVINQKEILQDLNSPFIINMNNAFQDREFLYLTMQYLKGGDLRYHMCFYESFSQQQTRFIVGCIILALEYIHSKGIIHRDIKPENLVFQETGYVRITDFGVARKNKENNSQQTSGTPGYMAPEVICRMNHSYEADFFALGVIIYEMMLGIRPYMGDSRKQIRDKILAHQAKITQKEIPKGWSPNCVDFINKLLKRNRQTRLGYQNINQLKSHPWLKSINWINLLNKKISPPFVPGIVSESIQYQRQMQNSECSEVDEETMMLLRTPQIQKLFKPYETSKKVKKIDRKNENKL